MRLTLHTDYAIRVLVYVGSVPGRLVTISEIAQCHGISKNHLTKVVHQLGKAGYLETVRGKSGGVRLSVAPQQVRLGDLVRHTEEDFRLARCEDGADQDGHHPCRLEATCVARHALDQGLAAFFAVLDRTTLADMLAAQQTSDQPFRRVAANR